MKQIVMSNKIVFLNTWHKSDDDRVYYHQAKSLANHGFEIQIISTKENCIKKLDNININSFDDSHLSRNEKTEKITDYLTLFSPAIIICDSPLAVFASNKYKKNKKVKIIYDITEWYPSKIHLNEKTGYQKVLKFIGLVILNIIAGLKSDSFIFGEYYKSIEYRILFFWKHYIILPYYPNLSYIQNYPLEKITTEINILYSGKINIDKGFDSVIKAINIASIKCPEIQFKLKIIGNLFNEKDQTFYNNLVSNLNKNININKINLLSFSEFCKTIGDTHLFIDLRKIDYENTHCLPIKLFYYLACGRPVIYSNLKSIRKEIKDFNFGYLCHPNDLQTISKHIIEYIKNPEIYYEHANNALNISRSKYNWDIIEMKFISFVANEISNT
jgi:glycosyltransferase involved in cell wall biosynthesis